MKSLLYQLRHYKLASLLNFIGIVLAFTGCYILSTQISYIGSYNKGIDDYENIRRIYVQGIMEEGAWLSSLNRPLLERLKECPQIESTGYFATYFTTNAELDKDGSIITNFISRGNADFLTTLNAKPVDGKMTLPDTKYPCVVIPASLAEKYFGNVTCAGKMIKFKDGETAQVTGVYQDFPDNCDITNAIYLNMGDDNMHEMSNWNYSAYIRVTPDTDEKTLNATLTKIATTLEKERTGMDTEENRQKLKSIKAIAMPVSKTYLNGYDRTTDTGSQTFYYILQLAVALLLIVALINFANFSMAQAPMRVRGINTRKVMGESNTSLRIRLMIEGVVISIAAFIFALILVYAIGQWENIGNYINGTLALQEHIISILLLFIISIVIGVLATAYSAVFVTSFPLSLALKGSFGLTPRGKTVRQLLVAFQLVLAFLMIIFVSVISSQRDYIYNSDYGFDKDVLMIGDVRTVTTEKKATIGRELEKINGVESVSFSMTSFGLQDFCMTWARKHNDVKYTFSAIPVDWKILPTLGIDIVEGRDFKETDGDVYIINEAMKKKYPNIEIDKPLFDGDLTVVGVCKNFRAMSTRIDNNLTPLAFIIFGKRFKNWGDQKSCMYVRLAANTDKKELRKIIEKTFVSIAGEDAPSDLRFQDECLEQSYQKELRFITQMETSTLLTFIITLIGVFCLTMFETEYRRKEIAIRKVMGSSVAEVLTLFTRRYALPLFLSFIIAAPAAYYISSSWLQHFAERTPIHWWIFPLSFLAVSAVVILTVIIQSWRVATMNPVNNLKTE